MGKVVLDALMRCGGDSGGPVTERGLAKHTAPFLTGQSIVVDGGKTAA
jgi:hypothetical protein